MEEIAPKVPSGLWALPEKNFWTFFPGLAELPSICDYNRIELFKKLDFNIVRAYAVRERKPKIGAASVARDPYFRASPFKCVTPDCVMYKDFPEVPCNP